MKIPNSAMQNDALVWDLRLHEFPATDGWTMTYFFAQGGETPISVVAAQNPNELGAYQITWTCPLPPGTYRWFLKATQSGAGRVIESGVLKINPDPSLPVDRRTHAEICLSAVKALIEGRLLDPGGSIVEYEIYEGLKVKQLHPEELEKLRDRYMTEIRMQRSKSLIRKYPVGRW